MRYRGVHRPGQDAVGRHLGLRATSVTVPGPAAGGVVTAPTEVTGQHELRTAWRDATARVQAEAERDAAARLVRSALQHSPIGFALRAVGGAIVQANAALGTMLGRPAGELVGHTLADFADPRDRTDDVDGEHELLAGGVAVHDSERRYVRGDGGVLWGHCTSVLLRDETGVPRHVLVHLQDITDRKSAVDQLARTAFTDPLTGLVNRTVFTDRLTRTLEHRHLGGSRVGVLFVDLDHFKPVNDALGHDVGDEVLRQTASRISLAVRHQDLVARLGGDEFVVLCPDVPDLVAGAGDVLADIAGRIVQAVAVPFDIAGHEVVVSASVGVTVADRRRGARDVLAAADAAMYQAKRAGRGRFAMAAEALETVALDELDLDADLGRGIAAGELRLLHQPIVHAPDRRVVAREALVRWQHPTRGLLGPGAFVTAAERSPLVVTLGNWVLDRACREAAGWADAVPVHVNVSASHLALTDFADTVTRALAASGLPAHRLRLEITETLALTGSASTLRSIAALTALGVGIHLDDFGTGYSSISALHQIPVTGLKIDISFVQDLGTPATAALVAGLIHLAHGMGLTVVAEGVEDTAQATWLVDHGCPLQQGDLHGRPSTVGPAHIPALHPHTATEVRP